MHAEQIGLHATGALLGTQLQLAYGFRLTLQQGRKPQPLLARQRHKRLQGGGIHGLKATATIEAHPQAILEFDHQFTGRFR
ncbi:MAG: hypothetical protein R3F17_16455 [Planctomycetota bacterium]